MKRLTLVAAAAALAAVLTAMPAAAQQCKGADDCRSGACNQSWTGSYYKVEWGIPLALVVPPTAESQTNWGWGVGNTRNTAICPRYSRNWPGNNPYQRTMFRPQPYYPSDTTQFGVYYVRGPW